MMMSGKADMTSSFKVQRWNNNDLDLYDIFGLTKLMHNNA